MIPLIKLREDLRFANELQDMIEVLKGATASQFRSLQRRRKGFEDFKTKLEEFLAQIDARNTAHPFLTERAQLPKAIVMITSDEGFLGSLNAMVINAGLEQSSSSDELIVMGERGARYLSESQSGVFTVLPGIGDDITYARAVAIRDLLISKFLSKKIGSVIVAYPVFLSLTMQRIEATRLLPCGDIFGQKKDVRRKITRHIEFLMEPSKAKVVDFMVRAYLMQKLYEMFWESKLSECAARIIHLEGSHEEILNANKKLKYEYFKHLHEKSDKNIREIFASRLRWRHTEAGEKA
ncbi:MAG: FoF1 ATP synthase subunit gamma [Candidatus Omnitrophota bacterium]